MGSTVGLINLTDGAVLSEDELVARAGEGDRSAFGALYLRHRDAARRAAGICTSSSADAEDAVAEGFARVFAALPRLAGRPIAFRAYLLTCVRNAATDRLRRERRIDLRESVPEERVVLESASDTALAGVERNLVGEAMQALPRRWRTVLWLTEVEGMTPAQVSSQIGIKPNAVAALAYRARRGLRDAYLQAHLRQETLEGCRGTVARLGLFVRNELAGREREVVESHLDQCERCRSRREELTDVNATIRAAFLPVPLLLAGLKGRWLEALSRSGALGRSPLEAAQLGAVGDSPMVHKAVAGIAALLMAVSAQGTSRFGGGSDSTQQAAPVTVMDTARGGLDFSVLPPDQLGGSPLQLAPGVGEVGGAPASESRATGTTASSPDVPSPAAGPTAATPGSRRLAGGTQSRFRGPDGELRQPEEDNRDDGLLGLDPVLEPLTGLADEIVSQLLVSVPLLAPAVDGVAAEGAEEAADPVDELVESTRSTVAATSSADIEEHLEEAEQERLAAEGRVAEAKAGAEQVLREAVED